MPNGSVVDLKRIKPSHQNFLKAHDDAVSRALNSTAVQFDVQQHVGNGVLLAKRSGNLVRSTSASLVRGGNRVLLRVKNTAKYAMAQEHGSGLYGPKHSKYPIYGNPLSFYWHRKRQHMLISKVMHPGVKPTHFLQVATDLAFQKRVALLRAGMNQAARHFKQ